MTPISIISHLHNRDYFHFEFYIQAVFFWVSWSKDWSLASSHGHKCNMLAITPHTLYMHRQKKGTSWRNGQTTNCHSYAVAQNSMRNSSTLFGFFSLLLLLFLLSACMVQHYFLTCGKGLDAKGWGSERTKGRGVCVGSGRENQLQLQLLLEAHHHE